MTVGTAPASVFDADLPTLTYERTETPAADLPPHPGGATA